MHFVIVSYTFPPSKEIGGRRWAKFSQYLKILGHEVTVVTSEVDKQSEFYASEFSGIRIRCLPKRYPNWLTGETRSILEKIKYHLKIKVLSLFTKRNFFDRGYDWERQLTATLNQIYNEKRIDVLIVTGAPFSLLYYGAKFKQLRPDVKCIVDFRDPWSWGDYYGLPTMRKRQREYQFYQEAFAIKMADLVCFPTKNLGDFLCNQYPDYKEKMYLLPHAYDANKFKKIQPSNERKGFIYGGTLYDGIEGYLESLSKVLSTYPISDFSWNIYTGKKLAVFDKLFTGKKVAIVDFVPEEELFKQIALSKAYLAFFPVSDKDMISTKFFEIIYTKTPILFIGEEGEVSEFIKVNKLGVHILPENIETEFPKYLNADIPFDPNYFDVSYYSFENVTKEFLKEIHSRFQISM